MINFQLYLIVLALNSKPNPEQESQQKASKPQPATEKSQPKTQRTELLLWLLLLLLSSRWCCLPLCLPLGPPSGSGLCESRSSEPQMPISRPKSPKAKHRGFFEAEARDAVRGAARAAEVAATGAAAAIEGKAAVEAWRLRCGTSWELCFLPFTDIICTRVR